MDFNTNPNQNKFSRDNNFNNDSTGNMVLNNDRNNTKMSEPNNFVVKTGFNNTNNSSEKFNDTRGKGFESFNGKKFI